MRTESESTSLEVQLHLRSALCAWYSWLSSQSMRTEDWKQVPTWCKGVPGMLDLRWALERFGDYRGHTQMILAFYRQIDSIQMSRADNEDMPDMSRLVLMLKSICEVSDE